MKKLQNQLAMFQVSEIKVIYQPKIKASERFSVSCSRDVFNVFRQSWDMNRIQLVEQFKILLLNRANKVLGIYEVSSGGMAGTVADPKLIFAAALKGYAAGIILAHNHPSGNLKPSQADINLTCKIKEGAMLLDIAVLDHIILSPEDSYYSFADEGLL
ncbi:JAB domain-containing protein [Desertivirga xinjiangensis]|uniref:JAB domain-containing protein n=1 Tax=Desertivirga xinjiangensis TaxID=539206 RepID=UPI00210DBC82|nr:JAB domain-containing protein [Pedobacter xinjiangensis]